MRMKMRLRVVVVVMMMMEVRRMQRREMGGDVCWRKGEKVEELEGMRGEETEGSRRRRSRLLLRLLDHVGPALNPAEAEVFMAADHAADQRPFQVALLLPRRDGHDPDRQASGEEEQGRAEQRSGEERRGEERRGEEEVTSASSFQT
eukprot:551822-Hanusia_phi.AAC.1